jgi:hypothetical protein
VKSLRCVCGSILAAETGEQLLAEVQAHLAEAHAELLAFELDGPQADLAPAAAQPATGGSQPGCGGHLAPQ